MKYFHNSEILSASAPRLTAPSRRWVVSCRRSEEEDRVRPSQSRRSLLPLMGSSDLSWISWTVRQKSSLVTSVTSSFLCSGSLSMYAENCDKAVLKRILKQLWRIVMKSLERNIVLPPIEKVNIWEIFLCFKIEILSKRETTPRTWRTLPRRWRTWPGGSSRG